MNNFYYLRERMSISWQEMDILLFVPSLLVEARHDHHLKETRHATSLRLICWTSSRPNRVRLTG